MGALVVGALPAGREAVVVLGRRADDVPECLKYYSDAASRTADVRAQFDIDPDARRPLAVFLAIGCHGGARASPSLRWAPLQDPLQLVRPQMWTRDRECCQGHDATMWLRLCVLRRIGRTTSSVTSDAVGESTRSDGGPPSPKRAGRDLQLFRARRGVAIVDSEGADTIAGAGEEAP